MQDGVLYSNILLKLYLKSLKNGGKLQLDENIPYTAQMIATITRQQVGTVERALQIFMKLGLVEPLQNGALYMSNIELLIGQSSTEGERKRRARRALQEQAALGTAFSVCPVQKGGFQLPVQRQHGGNEPAAEKRIADTLHTYARLAVIQ